MTTSVDFNPENYGIPADYRHWIGDQAEDHNGPFFFRCEEDGRVHTLFRVQAHNCNGHGGLHGGIMMLFADFTLCVVANRGDQDEGVVTVTCNNEFIGPAAEGELVEGYGEVLRRGGSLIFTRCTLRVGERTILNASAVVKRIRK